MKLNQAIGNIVHSKIVLYISSSHRGVVCYVLDIANFDLMHSLEYKWSISEIKSMCLNIKSCYVIHGLRKIHIFKLSQKKLKGNNIIA
jgi:hypothetical protein